ncbi:MAG TPA: hypothetical protein PKZ07_18510 [Sedimentisphaerales bacterium]|nr:hypothetical protein [Sedimentisphaerales bacterium]
MIEYAYDALGSCVAMTNSAGNVTQLYEYSVYGQVAASDASLTCPRENVPVRVRGYPLEWLMN